MTCVREPSDGDEVDGPPATAVRFDIVAGDCRGEVVVVVVVVPVVVQ